MTIKKISAEEEDDLGFRKIIDEKDAEISRMKNLICLKEGVIWELSAFCKEKNQLIISLADAAASYLSFDGSDKTYDAVKLQGARVKLRAEIQSARERLLSER